MKIEAEKAEFKGITIKLETVEEALFMLGALNQHNSSRENIIRMIPLDALRDMEVTAEDVVEYFERRNYSIYCDYKTKLSIT